ACSSRSAAAHRARLRPDTAKRRRRRASGMEDLSEAPEGTAATRRRRAPKNATEWSESAFALCASAGQAEARAEWRSLSEAPEGTAATRRRRAPRNDPGGDRTHDPVIKSHMLYH